MKTKLQSYFYAIQKKHPNFYFFLLWNLRKLLPISWCSHGDLMGSTLTFWAAPPNSPEVLLQIELDWAEIELYMLETITNSIYYIELMGRK